MRGTDEKRADRARALRRSLTRAEFLLWSRIRNRRRSGYNFVRQEPVGRYYADFARPERHLAIELDGGQRADSAADRQRDSDLIALGYRVIRIWNNDVVDNIDGVLQELLSELQR